jgi:hypothetical protein
MKHRFASAAVLAILIGGPSPAFAFPRVASFEWSPATGPVAGYAVYASIGGGVEDLVAAVAVPSADVLVASGVYVSVRVAAYDSAGRLGPLSDPAPLVRLCPGDFDGNEVIGMSDVTNARACFGSPADGFCAGADADLDGWIEFSDLQSLSLGSDACALAASSAACLGDLDGDHLIGFADFSQARACLGRPAQGACAAADFDGNGIISGLDVNLVRLAFGSNACAL